MKTTKVQVAMGDNADARPIAVLVQMASQYDSSVYIDCNTKHVNVKSIMGMMSLALKNGDSINLVTNGVDEELASDKLCRYLMGEAV